MFLKKINIYDKSTNFYKRAAKVMLFFNSIKYDGFKFNGNDVERYICDYEFLDEILVNKLGLTGLNKRVNNNDYLSVFILLDSFPTELFNLCMLSKDITYAFKTYLNDEQLDKLAKEK
jgi:hypothetical protein